MSGQCRNCTFWTGPIMEPLCPGLGACDLLSGREETSGTAQAFALDREGFKANLMCRGDFGCVHFKPKRANWRDSIETK